MSKLSRRGQDLVDSPTLAPYVLEHFARAGEPWEADARPEGYISLCVAENKLNSERLIEQLSRYEVPARVLGYDHMTGNLEFRERLAAFMGRSFLGRSFEAEQLAVIAGAGSVLETVFYALCDPGDAVLVPTPSYSGFWPDLETRDELQIVPVHCDRADDFRMSTQRLDVALEGATCPVKALLFTSPNNPLGRVYTAAEILEVVTWARAKGLQLVMDEIYALSVFGERKFTSIASLVPELGDDIHIIWAFSKDFGASGLRCGVLVSENTGLVEAVGGLAYWSAVSGHTQHLLSELVADEAVVDEFIASSQGKLGEAYARVTNALDAEGIGYLPAQAAFFLICDLREYLSASTWEAEHLLWRRILDEANVNITPGSACRINEPGFFRLCYAAVSSAALEAALAKLGRVLKTKTPAN